MSYSDQQCYGGQAAQATSYDRAQHDRNIGLGNSAAILKRGVPQAMEELAICVECLHKELHELRDRLSGVTDPEVPCDEKCPQPEPIRVGLIQEMHDIKERIRNLTGLTSSINKRLQL